jgi:hypothetical protein
MEMVPCRKLERKPMRFAIPVAATSTAAFAAIALSVALQQPYRPGDDLGYNLGLAGGVLMLVLLLYPARKRLAALRAAGPMKPWFQLHMALGVLGPLLVLFHTGFRVGSVNAAVALACMVVVALSGVIGRYAYRNIHHGLYGRKASLAEFEARMLDSSRGLAPLIKASPEVAWVLDRFKARAFDTSGSWWHRARRFATLGLHAREAARICDLQIARVLGGAARGRRWDDEQVKRLATRGHLLVRAYLTSIERASQFGVYERIFSLWHVLHLPLVWLLVASASYHVLAVHMY